MAIELASSSSGPSSSGRQASTAGGSPVQSGCGIQLPFTSRPASSSQYRCLGSYSHRSRSSKLRTSIHGFGQASRTSIHWGCSLHGARRRSSSTSNSLLVQAGSYTARTFLAIANVGRTSSPSPEDICSMNNIAYTDGQVHSSPPFSWAAFANMHHVDEP